MENILANVLKQELVYATMERQRQELDLAKYQWKTGIIFDKMNSDKKEQSLIYKTENLLDVIYDNFD